MACVLLLAAVRTAHGELQHIDGPIGSGRFGTTVEVLPNGNIVVVDPSFDLGATSDVGAVYLYDANAQLISRLTGSTAGDQIGNAGVVILPNGNIVISSTRWQNGDARDAGAVTWIDADVGLSGQVSGANSLIGNRADDGVGRGRIRVLANGHFVVASPFWDGALLTPVRDVGAVTWGDRDNGLAGQISSSNSLIGVSADDRVGMGVTPLTNGNFVLGTDSWDNGALSDVGAATWARGDGSTTGVVGTTNSIIGGTAADRVGLRVIALSNGNYLVCSPLWDAGGVQDAGAVTWVDGENGLADDTISVGAIVNASNSLIGSSTDDQVGNLNLALSNGNFIVFVPRWDESGSAGNVGNVGAVVFRQGDRNAQRGLGPIDPNAALLGQRQDDQVGSHGAQELADGNVAVRSPYWYDGSTPQVGAVTWIDGQTGRIWGSGSSAGRVHGNNSMIGGTAFDRVGERDIAVLDKGAYAISTPTWDRPGTPGATRDLGAVTWVDPSIDAAGTVSASNSWIGAFDDDMAGWGGVHALPGGNFVIASPLSSVDLVTRSGGAPVRIALAGAATFVSPTVSSAGVISSGNSLVGATTGDLVAYTIRVLASGHYVVVSDVWNAPGVFGAGAVTWMNGDSGETIAGLRADVVSPLNSLIGTQTNDEVGNPAVYALPDGHYAIWSYYWANGAMEEAGAVTLADGARGSVGRIDASNSVLGSVADAGDLFSIRYDPTRSRLVVGQPAANRVSLFSPAVLARLFNDGFETP